MSLSSLMSPEAYRRLKIERAKQKTAEKRQTEISSEWREWLLTLFPKTFNKPFAQRHLDLWRWIESIEADTKPAPSAYVDIEPRGGGKTTTAESAVIRLGATERRKFVLYVRGTQNKANESVQSIAAKVESKVVEQYYPYLSQRSVGKYGQSRGWRMDMLRCANGFNVLALGLDVAVRGAKIEDYRPDLIIFDDIDGEFDTTRTINKKVDMITKSIIPAGASHCAYLVVQNLIHPQSIVNTLANGTAEFLYDRIVSGPHPAVRNLTYEAREAPEQGYRITGGEPTWEGQNLTTCEEQINDWGVSSFLREAQHEVEESGGIWDHIEFRHCEWTAVPDLVRIVVWVDPAVTSTDASDRMGIQADGLAADGKIYRLYSWEAVTSPEDALKRAILKALELGADSVGVETDQGGDTWQSVYNQAWLSLVADPNVSHVTKETRRPKFKSAKAGAGHGSKVERNGRMLADYERGGVIHVIGTNVPLEKALKRFPNKPLDLADAGYWSWWDLRSKVGGGVLAQGKSKGWSRKK